MAFPDKAIAPRYTGAGISVKDKEQNEAIANLYNDLNTPWATWSPTLTFTGNTGSSYYTGTSVYRYMKIGKTVFFNVYMYAVNGTGSVNSCVISLPSTPVNTSHICEVRALNELDTDATWTDIKGYIDLSTATGISFRSWQATSAGAHKLSISGVYEAA